MIILVRHGEATHHTQHLTGGWTDSVLTEKGRAQLQAAAAMLARDFAGRKEKLRILASDLSVRPNRHKSWQRLYRWKPI